MKVDILPMLGQMITKAGPQTVRWPDIERLILDDREVAKIKTTPGAAISLFPHVRISAAEKQALSDAIAVARGGVPPAAIHATSELYEILKAGDDDGDADEEDTETAYNE